MGQILSFISGKGGTGKTSLCAAAASCLAAEGSRVLCVDLDIGLRNLDIALGMAAEPLVPFSAVMDGSCTLRDAAMAHPKIPNLYLLTAPVTLAPEDVDADAFAALLQSARDEFDFCLLDAPAGVGAGFRLCAKADRAVVVVGGDPASLRDGARAAALFAAQNGKDAGLIVNRVTKRLFARMKSTVDDVMDGVGLPLYGVVPEDPAVTLAAAEGIPLILYKSKGAAEAALHIARRLRGVKAPLCRIP